LVEFLGLRGITRALILRADANESGALEKGIWGLVTLFGIDLRVDSEPVPQRRTIVFDETRPLSSAEIDDQCVEFLPARTVLTTWPWDPGWVAILNGGDGGDGGDGGGTGGGTGGGDGGDGGNGGTGADDHSFGGHGGDGGNGGHGGNGEGGNGIGAPGIGGDGGDGGPNK
jgi:hypothetical protein